MPKKTHVEFMNDIMDYSPFGALAQVFVIQAVLTLAEAIAAADVKKLDTPLVSGQAWQGVAKDIVRRYKENYE